MALVHCENERRYIQPDAILLWCIGLHVSSVPERYSIYLNWHDRYSDASSVYPFAMNCASIGRSHLVCDPDSALFGTTARLQSSYGGHKLALQHGDKSETLHGRVRNPEIRGTESTKDVASQQLCTDAQDRTHADTYPAGNYFHLQVVKLIYRLWHINHPELWGMRSRIAYHFYW